VDAFLRRVVAQRELEQEAEICAVPPEEIIRRCRVCKRIVKGDSLRITVCAECGGRKKQELLVELDALAIVRAQRREWLLRCAGFKPVAPGELMSDRNCAKCGKKLRANNTGADCWSCRTNGTGEAQSASSPVPGPGRRAKSDAQKRFKVVATALGVDPDKLIAEFCEGWLERVRGSANFGNPDAN
jgi:hypothetical protein